MRAWIWTVLVVAVLLLAFGGALVVLPSPAKAAEDRCRRGSGRQSPDRLLDMADQVTLTGVRQPLREEDGRLIRAFLGIPNKQPQILSALAETLFQTVDPTQQSADCEKLISLLATEKEITAGLFLLDACYEERGWRKLLPEASTAELLPLARELNAISQGGTLREREEAFRRVLSGTFPEPLLSKMIVYLLVSSVPEPTQDGTCQAVFQYLSSEPRLRQSGIRLLTLETTRFGSQREAFLRLFLGEETGVAGSEDQMLAMRALAAIAATPDELERIGSTTFERKRYGDLGEFTDEMRELIQSRGLDPEVVRTSFVEIPVDRAAYLLFQECNVRVAFRTAEDRLGYVMECVGRDSGPPFSEALLLGSRHFPEEFVLASLDVLATSSDDRPNGKAQSSLMDAGKYISPEDELYPEIVARILAMAKDRNFSTRAILADTIAAMGCPETFVLTLLDIYGDSPEDANYQKYVVDSHVVESFRRMPMQELTKTFQRLLADPKLEPYRRTVWLVADSLHIPEQELE